MTDYPYDPDLPYVVTIDGVIQARFRSYSRAGEHAADLDHFRARVIDTTPKPRVPDDAEWILWVTPGDRYRVAQRNEKLWATRTNGVSVPLEDLPYVRPDTVFTVLDERKS